MTTKMIINVDGVEREATPEELKQHEIDIIEGAKYNAAVKQRIEAREALLKRLGITAEEAKLLLS